MPPIEKHVQASLERTGRDHKDIHVWIDGDPEKKAERHDVTKIYEFGMMIKEKYGEEGLQEYVRHIHDDMAAKFAHIMQDFERTIEDAFAYFGVRKPQIAGYGIQDADIALLREAGVGEEDIAHCVKVAEKAVEIAQRIAKTGIAIDMELVGRGALFHDLGKSRSHEIEHGEIGARIGEGLGLPKPITDIMEKHIRGGLTEKEARELGLPVKDYSLKTLEEKIVIYADRLVDIITDPDRLVSSEKEAEIRFVEILEGYPRYGKNDKTRGRYLGYHNELQRFM